MADIFEFDDYREYLKVALAENQSKGISIRKFTRSSGLASPNYFQMVISGKKNMSIQSAKKVAQALGLNRTEQQYLQTLISLASAGLKKELQAELAYPLPTAHRRLAA